MKRNTSRRNFLAASVGLPAAGLATVSTRTEAPAAPPASLQPAGELRYRTLGRTGLKLTSVGFGCMITSDPSVIEKAADLGINYFDSARGYQGGNNERMVGAALKGRRKQVHISTKTHAGTKAAMLADLETSLKELGTDYLDIWYMHGLSRADQLSDDRIDAQQTAKQQGKIRFAGFSTHSNQAEMILAGIQNGKIDVIDSAYNFTMQGTLEPALEAARKAGIGVVAMKVMAGGFRRVKPGSDMHARLSREGAMTAAVKWVLKNQNVHTTIPSMTDMEQLDQNFRAMAAPFSEKDAQLLARQLEYIAPLYCRMCGRCEGACSKGLPVADMLRFLTYAEGYGQFALGRENFLALPPEVTGVRCNLCASCEVTCPNGVRVAERLSRAQELFA